MNDAAYLYPVMRFFHKEILSLSKQQSPFEKREKQSESEHFTPYLSVARHLMTDFYQSYNQ
jgi:hypothetical protein